MNTVIFLTVALAAPPIPSVQGRLIAVGGGKTSEALVGQILQLAGGPQARILVIPQASELPETGDESAKMWRKAGAQAVIVLKIDDQALQAVNDATFIWMPGGDQNRLMKALPAPVIEAIQKKYQAGATVGGTSAGAAVLSTVMLTGDADLKAIRAGSTKTAPGLALWPDVIVDQHFIARQRFNRLLGAVLDQPALVGVGVDESTAAIFHAGTIEVAGAGQVLIIDARHVEKPIAETPRAARGVVMHLLTAGMKFTIAEK